jgi:hypothetical protein
MATIENNLAEYRQKLQKIDLISAHERLVLENEAIKVSFENSENTAKDLSQLIDSYIIKSTENDGLIPPCVLQLMKDHRAILAKYNKQVILLDEKRIINRVC